MFNCLNILVQHLINLRLHFHQNSFSNEDIGKKFTTAERLYSCLFS